MKLTRKGHELDEYAKLLMGKSQKQIYVMGYGKIGQEVSEILAKCNLLFGIIDNDIQKQNKIVYGRKILSLKEYLCKIKKEDACIVLAVGKKIRGEIEKEFLASGYVHWKNIFYYQEFLEKILPILAVYKGDTSYVSLAQICVTERCTLKCKKCAHGCYVIKNDAMDLPLEDVYKSADSFFSKVDYIREFVLIGGEPCLYKDLDKVIEYIGSKYREKMYTFSITTNGTIVPPKHVLKLCKKYDVLFRISNYTERLPRLEENHKRLLEALDTYEVFYVLGAKETEWMDYGFEYVNRECSEDELIKVFSSCNTPCREVRGNKYYYCVMARSVSENLGFNIGQDDYLDLDKLTDDNYKKELLEFNCGYSEKGYLDMCRHCHGKDTKNYPIPAAEQL